MSKEVTEALNNIAAALWGVADAITPRGAGHAPGTDAVGGSVGSLTEAMMGITAALTEHDDHAYAEEATFANYQLEAIATSVAKLADKE